MSAEAKLREALSAVFENDRWYDDSGDILYFDLSERLDEVISLIKQGEWLITGGAVLGVQFAWPASGIFTDQEWVVRVAQG